MIYLVHGDEFHACRLRKKDTSNEVSVTVCDLDMPISIMGKIFSYVGDT